MTPCAVTRVTISASLTGTRQPVLHRVGPAPDRSARRPPRQRRTIKTLGAALPVSADDAVSTARVRFRNRPQPAGAAGVGCALKLPGGAGDGSAEVFAGGDAQFGEHVAQVPLDGMGADEQRDGDLLVGLPVPGQL